MSRRRWSAADVAVLRSAYGEAPVFELAMLLGRTVACVNWKACRLGLTRGKAPDVETLSSLARKYRHTRDWVAFRLRAAGVPFGRERGKYRVINREQAALALWVFE